MCVCLKQEVEYCLIQAQDFKKERKNSLNAVILIFYSKHQWTYYNKYALHDFM